jgi:hypothetical protein
LPQSTPWNGVAFIVGLALVSAVITVFFWLSLIGLAPSVYAHRAARTKPTDQSTSATTSSNTKIKGKQQI